MKIADKYIFRQLCVGFLLVLVSLTLLVWLTQSLRMIDMVVSKGASVWVFLQLTLLVLPNFLQILMPLALFAVILFVFVRMQSDKELMVLKAVGMSSAQLMRPVMYLTGILVGLGYLLSFWIIPDSTNAMREMKWKIQNNLSSVLLQEGQFNTFKRGMMIYVKERLPNGGVKGILAYEIKDGKKTALIADEGTIYQTSEGFDILFGQGARQEYIPQTNQFSVLKFDKYTVSINEHMKSESIRIQKVNELPFLTLLETSREKAPSEGMWRKYKVEAVKRLTYPLYNLVFALLALVGVLTGFYDRRGQSWQINTVVGVALLIQTLSLAFENLAGKHLWAISLMLANIVVPLLFMRKIFRKDLGKRLGKFLFLAGVSLSVSAHAFVDIDASAFDKKSPIDFSSDKVSYNLHNKTMTATGDVQLNQNGTVFKTQKILYNQEQDMIHIPGSATMILPDGNQSSLVDVRIYPQKDEVITGKTRADFIDGSTLMAEQVVRQGKEKSNTLKDAYYTPCEICENKAPLWQLHARTVEQDEQSHLLRFWNSFFEVKNVPIFYFPYFQIPDFTIKRKTGFLLPGFGSDSTIKTYIKIPYFIDLAPNQNLTLTPIISLSQNPMGIVDYRGLFTQGEFNFQGSLTKDDAGKSQGHVKTNFIYDISDEWRLSGEFSRTITDTYFRRYSVIEMDETQSFLTSDLKAEYYGNQLQGISHFYHFQSLQDGMNSKTIPLILPTFQANYHSKAFTEQGGHLYTQVSGAFINDRTHFKSNRMTWQQGVILPHKTNFGLVMNLEGMIRFDGYSIDSGQNLTHTLNVPNDSYWMGRAFPRATLKMSYPMAQYSDSMTQILEPIVMLVGAPNGENSDKIPNVDSTVFDFNDVNLFSSNRYAGYDRVESGSRLNYGVQWSLYPKNDLPSVQFLFGQSYRLRHEDELTETMGYHHNLSSYVGRIKVDYKFITMMYRFRLMQENFKAQKNDFVFEIGRGPLRLGMDYLYQDGYKLGTKMFNKQEEITLYGRSKLTQNWSLEGRYRYNFLKTERGPLEASAVLRYDNDCAAVEFEGRKSYTKGRDYKGNSSVSVRLYLKTLGGIGQ